MICLTLLVHWMRAAASRTFCTAGRSRPISTAMMAMTTNNSSSVKPGRRLAARCPSIRSLRQGRILQLLEGGGLESGEQTGINEHGTIDAADGESAVEAERDA